MSLILILSALAALGLLVYLLAALFFPEHFS
ncbi:MAG: K(+)-transporting ATPase subunit F [Betaproteobacteria bacterium]|nr:K(+)-transporting ATPase subunit F [Betaproteobacteria bacterium]